MEHPWQRLFWFLFGLEGRVSRRQYLVTGSALMALKYAGDCALSFAARGEMFTPWQYLSPVSALRLDGATLPGWAVFAMVVWALPFLWIGLGMSLRRALDADKPPATALLFLVPIINLLVIAGLAIVPSQPLELEPGLALHAHERSFQETRIRIASVVGGAFLSVALAGLSVLVLGEYAGGLFLGTPAVIGFLAGWLSNRRERRSFRATMGLATVVAFSASGALLLFALEGIVCLVMAFPLVLLATWLGAAMGRAWATRVGGPQVVMMLLSLPILMGAEHQVRDQAPLREVVSEVTIAAPPEVVWQNVIGFSELPPPNELLFAFGFAYPVRAEIRGEGVGSVRHCVFSTGPFVEPITVWEPPHRLAFDVTEQPPGMRESSPYNHVYAPHLEDYPQSERGEFRLLRTPNGHTRLIGTTWYRLELFPQIYWTPMSDVAIHAIHERVLAHIKALSER